MFKFTATVEIEAESCTPLSRRSLAGSHQELANGQMDGTGPLGKGSSINTPRVQFWGDSVCAGLSTPCTANLSRLSEIQRNLVV